MARDENYYKNEKEFYIELSKYEKEIYESYIKALKDILNEVYKASYGKLFNMRIINKISPVVEKYKMIVSKNNDGYTLYYNGEPCVRKKGLKGDSWIYISNREMDIKVICDYAGRMAETSEDNVKNVIERIENIISTIDDSIANYDKYVEIDKEMLKRIEEYGKTMNYRMREHLINTYGGMRRI